MKNKEPPNLNCWCHTNNYRDIGARRLFIADANIGRKVYVCTNLCNDCPINRGLDHLEQTKETNNPILTFRLKSLIIWGLNVKSIYFEN